MADYSQDIVSARADIAEAGLVCQLVREGSGFDVPAVLTNVDPKLVDGDIIRFTDYAALLPGGLERNPDPEQDKLQVPACDLFPNGDLLRVVTAKPLAPSGQAIIWELVLRK